MTVGELGVEEEYGLRKTRLTLSFGERATRSLVMQSGMRLVLMSTRKETLDL